MTINQILYFKAVVEHNTFLDAAETLHLSQSSLSKSIQRLEEELGCRLLDRSARSAVPTPEGLAFYNGSQNILAAYYQTMDEIQEISRNAGQQIRLAALPLLSQYQFTEKIQAFLKGNTGIHIDIQEMEDPQIQQALLDGTCDLAITRKESLPGSAFPFYPLTEDRLVVLLPENHSLASRPALSLKELAGEKFIFISHHISIYDTAMKACRKCGFTPDIVRTARIESIVSAVRSGEGISLLPEKSISIFQLTGVKQLALTEPITSTVVAALPSGKHNRKPLKELISYLKDANRAGLL